MRKLLRKIEHWRHNDCKSLGLAGHEEKYDFFVGCFGNPKEKLVFIAEIASSAGLDRIRNKEAEKDLWKTAWGRDTAAVFKKALMHPDYNFIPKSYGDMPWEWNCWITNFVKCAEKYSKWEGKGKHQTDRSYEKIKEKVLADSAAFLLKELRILRPDVMVLVGNNVRKYFRRFQLHNKIKKIVPQVEVVHIYHYAARSPIRERLPEIYHRQLGELIRKWP